MTLHLPEHPESFLETLARLERSGEPFVCITMVDAVGSTPQDAGSRAIVTTGGLHTGTIGGGRVEAKAIDFALDMISTPDSPRTRFVEWNLNRDVGMTCGGIVRLFFESFHINSWNIVIFGAGHVAQSLTRLLADIPCRVDCHDPRPEWVSRLPARPNIRGHVTDDLPAVVDSLPDNAFVLCMTMGHRTDKPILERIFKSGRRFPYLGVIGSAAKAATLRKELAESGIPADRTRQFICPVGLPIGTNHPTEIAISIAAQLIETRDALAKTSAVSDSA